MVRAASSMSGAPYQPRHRFDAGRAGSRRSQALRRGAACVVRDGSAWRDDVGRRADRPWLDRPQARAIFPITLNSNPTRPPMAKTNTVIIKLVSSADTGFYYVTKKNPRTKTNKLELKKFDPVARKHVIFKEAKIK